MLTCYNDVLVSEAIRGLLFSVNTHHLLATQFQNNEQRKSTLQPGYQKN